MQKAIDGFAVRHLDLSDWFFCRIMCSHRPMVLGLSYSIFDLSQRNLDRWFMILYLWKNWEPDCGTDYLMWILGKQTNGRPFASYWTHEMELTKDEYEQWCHESMSEYGECGRYAHSRCRDVLMSMVFWWYMGQMGYRWCEESTMKVGNVIKTCI